MEILLQVFLFQECGFQEQHNFLCRYIFLHDLCKHIIGNAEKKDDCRLILQIILMQTVGKYHRASIEKDKDRQINALEKIIDEMPECIGGLIDTWLERNRYSYLDDSIEPLKKLFEQARNKLSELKQSI